MNMETYTILEYESFTREQDINHNSFKLLPKATFDKLKQFIIESKSFGDVDGLDIMSISHKKHIGEVITAKNYVGLIVLNDGTIIEILPKIANADESDTKRILLNMLRTLVELPFKTLSTANLDMAKLPLLEVFISMFIKEVDSLVKKGLKSEYLTYQANETALKGKLLFNNHLKYNFVHKERFFVEYHPYNINRAENKLIKTTLQYLYRLCRNAQNKKALVNLLNLFDDIDISKNIDVDFSNCSNTRDMRIYEQTLKWARIFLKGNSFTNLQGTHLATALLFPNVYLGGVVTIGEKSFHGCNNLVLVDFGESLKKIAAEAFLSCARIGEQGLTFPETLEDIGESAFKNCVGLKSFNVPFKLVKIRTEAFFGCVNLETIDGTLALHSSYERVFQNCSSLERVDIGVKKIGATTHGMLIGNESFVGCTSLEFVSIGEGIRGIPYNFFVGCSSL